jgi:hypothetical protein
MTVANHFYGGGCVPPHRTEAHMGDGELGELLERFEVCIRDEEQARRYLADAVARTQACRLDLMDALLGRSR